MTLSEIIIRNSQELAKGVGRSINILKVDKRIPKKFINDNEPYFNKQTKIINYINFYDIKSNHCDIIIEIL